MKRNLLFAAVLIFSTAVFSLEVKSQYTHIYEDDEGASELKNLSLGSKVLNDFQETVFSFDSSYNEIKSTHRQLNIDLKNFNFSSFYKNDFFGLTGSFGFFDSSEIKTDFGKKISNDGAYGFYMGFEAPFEIYQLELKPWYYFGSVNFRQGDFAYFMGYPVVPYFMFYGLDMTYKKNWLQLMYIPVNINILTNDSLDLFSSNHFLTGGLYWQEYNLYFDEVKICLNPFAGYYFVNGKFNGALTQENQQVIYFVFDYFKINAAYNIHSALIGSNAKLFYKFIKLNFDSAILFILHESADVNIAWKKLDGLATWQEKLIWNSLDMEMLGSRKFSFDDLDKAGLFVCNLAAEISFLKNHGAINLQKKIFVPFSLKKEQVEQTEETTQTVEVSEVDKSLVKNILMSGITVGVTIRL